MSEAAVDASYGRRAAAGAVDAGLFLGGVGAVGIGIARWLADSRWGRVRAWFEDPQTFVAKTARFGHPARVAGFLVAIGGRNWRSPGMRLLGLRRVDAATDGPLGVRSALIAFGLQEGQRVAGRRVVGPRLRRSSERMAALQPQLKEIQREHSGDPEARQKALMEFYEEHEVNPFRSCPWLLPGLIIPQLPAWWSERRQTWVEWLAGTVVVVEPKRSMRT